VSFWGWGSGLNFCDGAGDGGLVLGMLVGEGGYQIVGALKPAPALEIAEIGLVDIPVFRES